MEWRRKFATGDVIIVRYADDCALGFQYRKEAERFLEQLRKRLADYGLELHSDKTRLIQFGRFAVEDRKRKGRGNQRRLIFWASRIRHVRKRICGTIHKSGKFTVHRKTVGQRMRAKLRSIGVELRRRMHQPLVDTGEWLNRVVRGYFNYHAVPGNSSRLHTFRQEIARYWRWTLGRRGQRSPWTWERFKPLMDHYLPQPRVLHPYPLARFYAKHPR